MKHLYGTEVYVQSVGVENDLEIDGFAIAVCREIGVELERHQTRSFEEMEKMGETLSGFDCVVTMSPASQRRALDLTRFYHLSVEFGRSWIQPASAKPANKNLTLIGKPATKSPSACATPGKSECQAQPRPG